MGAPENNGFKRACRSAVAIVERVHGAHVTMQRQRLDQRVVFPELPVQRPYQASNGVTAFRPAFGAAVPGATETDVVAIAAKLPRWTMIVVTAGYNASVELFDKALVDWLSMPGGFLSGGTR